MSFVGYSYVYGGSKPSTGFDCSGLMYYCLTQYGYSMNRVANDQMSQGTAVSREQLIVGDLVFFGYSGYANHVGMYIGNGNFVHASSPSTGVRVNSLNETYYNTRYIGARRIITG
ncbi:MAG: C40 family peptidase [Oscillospiraceae bacterium]|nr:C40 family peptidase [Oscillospiraceae bacterium]